MFLARLSNGVYGSIIPKRYNSSLQLGKLKHTWKNVQGIFQRVFFPEVYLCSPVWRAGGAGDPAAPRDDGDPDPAAAACPGQGHHPNTCGGAARYSASQ